MPAQKTKSALMAKYGAKLDSAVKTHAGDETKTRGFTSLPGGIRNGIAKLTECGFAQVAAGKTNAGEYYFRAAGVVVEPEQVTTKDGPVKVKGLQTSTLEMVCDTKTQKGKVTTIEEHVVNILNTMRLLAGDEFTADADGSKLEDLAAALEATNVKDGGLYFNFTTSESAGDPTEGYLPRVWENWGKGIPDYVPSANGDGVQDNSGDGSTGGPNATAQATDEPDLDALAEAADGEDEDARVSLQEIAKAAGIDEEALTAADNWAAVVELIKGATVDNTSATEPAEFVPKKGQIYNYKVIDAKTGKPAKDVKTKKEKKPVEVEVKAVNAAKKTVDLVNNSDKTTVYKDVPYDALESGE